METWYFQRRVFTSYISPGWHNLEEMSYFEGACAKIAFIHLPRMGPLGVMSYLQRLGPEPCAKIVHLPQVAPSGGEMSNFQRLLLKLYIPPGGATQVRCLFFRGIC